MISEEDFEFKIGDKFVYLRGKWNFDKDGVPCTGSSDKKVCCKYCTVTGIGRTMFFFSTGYNEHVDSKMNSFTMRHYNPDAKHVDIYK